MRAILLAAGQGQRLRPHTKDRPKCLVELCGRPLLAHQCTALHAAGVTELAIVTGYQAERLSFLPPAVRRFHNPEHAVTNMVRSLMCARAWLDGGAEVLVAYTDIVFESQLVRAVAASTAPVAVVVDQAWRRLWEARMPDPLVDAETLRLGAGSAITSIGEPPRGYHDIDAQFVGLVKVSAEEAPRLLARLDALGPDFALRGRSAATLDMTTLLALLIAQGVAVTGVPVEGGWLEVDSVRDLRVYEGLAATGSLATFWSPQPGPTWPPAWGMPEAVRGRAEEHASQVQGKGAQGCEAGSKASAPPFPASAPGPAVLPQPAAWTRTASEVRASRPLPEAVS